METPESGSMAKSGAENCSLCGEKMAVRSIQTQQFPYKEGNNEVLLIAQIPTVTCAGCGETYTAEGAEEAQHDAVCHYLGRLTPSEIRALRDRNGLSQAKLAEMTGIGIASIKRWESGNLIQSAALDASLRAVDNHREHAPIARPTSRFRTAFSADTIARSSLFELRPNKHKISVAA